jgi:RNA polymerase sigma factor (sigma-70 family)
MLTQELHRPPTEKELADHLKITETKVQDITDKVSEPISLDMCMGDEEDSVLVDFIEDKSAPSPVDCASRLALREELERSFSCLSEREIEVLRLRYGMDGTGHQRTLDEVGAALGLTRERIRQIEKVAIKRLKRLAPLRETAQGSGLLPPGTSAARSMIIGEPRRTSAEAAPAHGDATHGDAARGEGTARKSSSGGTLAPTASADNGGPSHQRAGQGVVARHAARRRAAEARKASMDASSPELS